MIRLGVNIDHVATVRQARQGREPDPVAAAALAELAGADGITVHLREDRRHICDRDVQLLRQTVRTRLNLEMSVAPEIVRICGRMKPEQATLVPERRQEITTEGGLDVCGQQSRIADAVKQLSRRGITVSLFIDPLPVQIDATVRTGASVIELHTGAYANAKAGSPQRKQLQILARAAAYAQERGLQVNAGHGLDYWNVPPLLAAVPGLQELNIGHAIISRAVLIGLPQAVRDMKALLENYG